MIAANKKFLKANLTQGVLGIQTNLIDLYTENLHSAATQAAVISGFAFTAVAFEFSPEDNQSILVLGYFYYTAFTICLVSSLYVLTQATVVVMFGPTHALKGASDDAVKFAAAHMRKQQMKILKAQAVTMTALFVTTCIYCWAIYSVGVATITTVIIMTGYYFLVIRHLEAYRVFVPLDQKSGYVEPILNYENFKNHEKTSETSNKATNLSPSSSHKTDNNNNNNNAGESKQDQQMLVSAHLAAAQEATKFRLRTILWKRQSIEDGGLFVKYFAVLEKGRLDFYKKESDYREGLNPVNQKPIKLWQFDLESDYRKYSKQVTSLTSAVKSSVMGNEDFAMSDLLSSEYDLQFASRNYKFGLVPKVQSELVASTVHELLAHDEKSYRTWIHALSTVMKGYDDIAANPSVEQTIRVGTADVETVVQAANNRV